MRARPSWAISERMIYALVASDSDFAIDLYPSHEQAEEALRQALADEPAFTGLLSVEPIPPPEEPAQASLN